GRWCSPMASWPGSCPRLISAGPWNGSAAAPAHSHQRATASQPDQRSNRDPFVIRMGHRARHHPNQREHDIRAVDHLTRGDFRHDQQRGRGSPVNRRLTVAAGLATVLASIALYPLLAGGIWFWGGIGAVIVVGGIGAVNRRYPAPAGVCFLAAIGGLFLYLNAVFAHRQSWVGVVPTGASLPQLGLLVMQGSAEISHRFPPVPPRPGIVLVVVAGIGLVGALTDLLAVRLHRPAIAGIPLLVLFCVPLTTDVKYGAVGEALVFCVGVVGY